MALVRRSLPRLNGRIQMGLVFLVLGSLWRWLVHPSARLSSGWVDGIAGILYGISIGCLLTGLRRNTLRDLGGDETR